MKPQSLQYRVFPFNSKSSTHGKIPTGIGIFWLKVKNSLVVISNKGKIVKTQSPQCMEKTWNTPSLQYRHPVKCLVKRKLCIMYKENKRSKLFSQRWRFFLKQFKLSKMICEISNVVGGSSTFSWRSSRKRSFCQSNFLESMCGCILKYTTTVIALQIHFPSKFMSH